MARTGEGVEIERLPDDLQRQVADLCTHFSRTGLAANSIGNVTSVTDVCGDMTIEYVGMKIFTFTTAHCLDEVLEMPLATGKFFDLLAVIIHDCAGMHHYIAAFALHASVGTTVTVVRRLCSGF